MAVDLGTSFIKCGVYDTQSRCVEEAMEPVKDERPSPGVFIQRGDELYSSKRFHKRSENGHRILQLLRLPDRCQDLWEWEKTGRILPHGPVHWIPGICHMRKDRCRS